MKPRQNARNIVEELEEKARRKKGLGEDGFGRTVVRGLIGHMIEDGRIGLGMVGSMYRGPEGTQYYDDIPGEPLEEARINMAREEELEEFRKHGVYTKVPLQECWEATGKPPVGTRWVEVNKGGRENPEYRSRLVAQEVKTDKREDLFAATPPLEAKKMLLAIVVSQWGMKHGRRMKLDFIDVRRAYFHAKARRDVFFKLPGEDHE